MIAVDKAMEKSKVPIEAMIGLLALRAEGRELSVHAAFSFLPGSPKTFVVGLAGSGQRAWHQNIELTMEQARALAVWLVENLAIEPEPPPPPPPPALPRWQFWRRAPEIG